MVVDDVAAALRSRDAVGPAFVAGCAERMALFFTGSRGGIPSRADDVELYVRAVDLLWDGQAGFASTAGAVAALPELVSQEELTDDTDIDAFQAALTLHYALSYRVDGDVEHAAACAHVVWTAMGLLDNNIAGAALADAELGRQREVLAMGEVSPAALARLRAEDQALSRERFSAACGEHEEAEWQAALELP
ncbi:hypothetical protein [Actinokineospora enzanensis]|uniref:hypothetical protein n=1 Tax=Actinokineospora enzanensis TaxID=155975 RepID=UPI00035DADE0|nr:hypothetical protein [Actinokineospora enzanensis]